MATRVLVAAQHPMKQTLIRIHLERAGFDVTAVHDGAEALRRIDSDLPDMLMTEVMLPKVDGFELAVRIRQRPNLAALPILFMGALRNQLLPEDPPGTTGETIRQSLVRDLSKGLAPCDYLVVPFNPAAMVRMVESLLTDSASRSAGLHD